MVMMTHGTHVYLGPTLDLQTAKAYLPDACYHPPIKCGDLIRLLRLKPKRIVIIDGIYEQVPAVWHKEIMLGLDHGIDVFGAASMGALRAAELHPFGMKGVGQVFQDFLDKTLNDDDEIAVLHHHYQQHYEPINDAMVNIRATLAQAYQENVISLATKEALVAACKREFYPYRSLNKSILAFAENAPDDCRSLLEWVSIHGLVDIKRQDAQLVLMQVGRYQASGVVFKSNSDMPFTKFIASLVDDAEIEAFDVQAACLPEQETNIQALFKEKKGCFQLVKTLASLMKIVLSIPTAIHSSLNLDMLHEYIRAHALYSPERDFQGALHNATCSRLYAVLSQLICQGSMKQSMIAVYVPVAAFYFQLDVNQLSFDEQRLLRVIVVCLCAAHTQLADRRLKIKSSVLADHLRDVRLWPRLKQHHLAHADTIMDTHTLIEFIALYMEVAYVYQGTRDTINGAPDTPVYFNWLYDAFDFLTTGIHASSNVGDIEACSPEADGIHLSTL